MFPLDRFHAGWSKLRKMNLIFAARHGTVEKKKEKTMSIRNKNGIWYYEFMKAGHRYCGTCLDEHGTPTGNQRIAEAYEKAQKEMCAKVRANKSIKALTENFRAELTGAQAIPLHEAFQRSLSKPRKRTPCQQRLVLKRNHWKDFISYMADTYPDVTHLAAVSRHHAENYVASLVTFGKFRPRQAGRRRIANPLSGATISDYITTITEVFELLAEDAGLYRFVCANFGAHVFLGLFISRGSPFVSGWVASLIQASSAETVPILHELIIPDPVFIPYTHCFSSFYPHPTIPVCQNQVFLSRFRQPGMESGS